MKPLVCIYCEGNDTKIAVVNKLNDVIHVHRTASFDFVNHHIDAEEGLNTIAFDGGEDMGLIGAKVETQQLVNVASASVTGVQLVGSALRGLNLSNYLFIPAITEPVVYFHHSEARRIESPVKSKKKKGKGLQEPQENQGIELEKGAKNYVELADKTILSVVISGEVPCLNLINNLARAEGKRFFKIPKVKNAEISLAYYVAKKKKFFPDDNSLIVYIGKEYSKLIFMQGHELKHIGSTIDIGTINLHTYDVYFSKILLEMENGGISQLDNIVVCGEDDSENLILSFFGTFPEADVTRLDFDELDISEVDSHSKEIFSSFTVPIAIATEYFDELEGNYQGINLLPKYVKEEQKTFQFAWHGYAMLPLLFFTSFFLTYQILVNQARITKQENEIKVKTEILRQNQQIVTKIKEIEAKISGFDQTKIILDSASAGTGVYSKLLSHLTKFVGGRKAIWVTGISSTDGLRVTIEGYSTSKNVATEFAYSFPDAELRSMVSEELKGEIIHKYNINVNLSSFKKNDE